MPWRNLHPELVSGLAWIVSVLLTMLAAPVLVVVAGLEAHYQDDES